jgi:hypothetical protein
MSHFGFIYDVQCFTRTGKLKWREVAHNIITQEAQNYMISAAVLNGARYISWYVGVYNNNYAGLPGDTMVSFSPNAGEDTNYDETSRPLYVPDPLGLGLLINDASPAQFTFNAARTIRGGFICSSSDKGSTSGLLLSAALFDTARSVLSGETLNVKGGMQLYSA